MTPMPTPSASRPTEAARRAHPRWPSLWLCAAGALAALGPLAAPAPASDDRALGRFVPPERRRDFSVLLRRARGANRWQRVDRDRPDVAAGDRLVSLPGYRSQLALGRGLRLTLWGDLPELSFFSPFLESAVVLHPSRDYDLDLDLDHGRVVIASAADRGARVRVTFEDPGSRKGTAVWEIKLAKKSEVSLELWGRYPPGAPFSTKKDRELPYRELYLVVLRNEAEVHVGDTTYGMEAPPGSALLVWNSDRGASNPRRLQNLPEWSLGPAPIPKGLSRKAEDDLRRTRADMTRALGRLDEQLKGRRVEDVLEDDLKADDASLRVLAVRCLGAVNGLAALADALADRHPEVRRTAIEELRHWSGLHNDNDLDLHELLMRRRRFTRREADSFMDMLHGFSEPELGQPETYARLIDYLRQDRPALRVLAHWHLVRLVPQGRTIPYDPLGRAAELDKAYDAWKKLVPEGSVPKPPAPPREPIKPRDNRERRGDRR